MITLIQLGNESLHTLEGALRRMGFGCCRAERPDQAAPLGPIILMGTGPLDPASLQLKTSACISWPKAARSRRGAPAWA